MNKRVRTGLITLVIAALAGYGIHTFYPLGQKADKDDVPWQPMCGKASKLRPM